MTKCSSIISFGQYQWRVLTKDSDKALLIADEILFLKWYHNAFIETTWEDSAIRRYLNQEFLTNFSMVERQKIIAVKNENYNNPWFGTRGGNPTKDFVFLLSLIEVASYFGDSRNKLFTKENQKWLVDDANNLKRQAEYEGTPHWWRLRSPGYYSRTAASVNSKGQIYVRGNGVYGSPKDGGGIRPALWIRL